MESINVFGVGKWNIFNEQLEDGMEHCRMEWGDGWNEISNCVGHGEMEWK
jgi:hypothetical protein